ncbi:MAG: hypothetical protein KA735_03015 [Burkholderiaceae bacterium]|nr:hypothetical protein [Burkholderiaceae bacterium]
MNWPIRCVIHDVRQRTLTLSLALVFLLHALIPMGYMPAARQGQATALSLSMCVSGLSAATVRVLDLDSEPSSPEHTTLYCALASVLGHDGPPVGPIVYLAIALFSGVILHSIGESSIPLWLVRGPPLGARAPPVYR